MDPYTLAHTHGVKAECSFCGQVVGVHYRGGQWEAVVADEHRSRVKILNLFNCPGSNRKVTKFVTIRCPVCRAQGMHGHVPSSGRAFENGLCCKHDRMKNGPLPK